MKPIARPKLSGYLFEIDVQCNERLELMVEQMKVQQGITEEVKAKDMMEWAGRMNEIRSVVEVIVMREIVYHVV